MLIGEVCDCLQSSCVGGTVQKCHIRMRCWAKDDQGDLFLMMPGRKIEVIVLQLPIDLGAERQEPETVLPRIGRGFRRDAA